MVKRKSEPEAVFVTLDSQTPAYPFVAENGVNGVPVPIPLGPYNTVGMVDMGKLTRKKIKLAGGSNVRTRDEDPRIDMVQWMAGVIPKSSDSDSEAICNPPYQPEAWMVLEKDLKKILREDIADGEPYTRLFPPPASLNLESMYGEFVNRQMNEMVEIGLQPEDITPEVRTGFCRIDTRTEVVSLSLNGITRYDYPPLRIKAGRISDEAARSIAAPPSKVNYNDDFHQTMKEISLQKIKKYEEREKRRAEIELQRRKTVPVVPEYKPGVRGTPKVPRFEPQWLINKPNDTASKQRKSTSDPPYVWPPAPKDEDVDSDDDDADEDEFLSDLDTEVSKQTKRKKKKMGLPNGKTESSKPRKQQPPLILKIKKTLKRDYETMMSNKPPRASAPRPKPIPKEPKIKPSIALITDREEQERLEKLKEKIEEKQEKKVSAPVVIVDPRIQKEQLKEITKAKKEQAKEAKLAAALVKTRGPELPHTCFGSLNPERVVSNGEAHPEKAVTNGYNGITLKATLKNFRIPRKPAANIYSMPDLGDLLLGDGKPPANDIPQGSLASHSQMAVNGDVTSASVDEPDNMSVPVKMTGLIPVASDEDEDDHDILDIFVDEEDDLFNL